MYIHIHGIYDLEQMISWVHGILTNWGCPENGGGGGFKGGVYLISSLDEGQYH